MIKLRCKPSLETLCPGEIESCHQTTFQTAALGARLLKQMADAVHAIPDHRYLPTAALTGPTFFPQHPVDTQTVKRPAQVFHVHDIKRLSIESATHFPEESGIPAESRLKRCPRGGLN
jgi:hypothetical protein